MIDLISLVANLYFDEELLPHDPGGRLLNMVENGVDDSREKASWLIMWFWTEALLGSTPYNEAKLKAHVPIMLNNYDEVLPTGRLLPVAGNDERPRRDHSHVRSGSARRSR